MISLYVEANIFDLIKVQSRIVVTRISRGRGGLVDTRVLLGRKNNL
jgi:hypothetical protein